MSGSNRKWPKPAPPVGVEMAGFKWSEYRAHPYTGDWKVDHGERSGLPNPSSTPRVDSFETPYGRYEAIYCPKHEVAIWIRVEFIDHYGKRIEIGVATGKPIHLLTIESRKIAQLYHNKHVPADKVMKVLVRPKRGSFGKLKRLKQKS